MDGMTFLGFVLIVATGLSGLAVTLELLSTTRQRPADEEAKRATTGVLAAESMAASIPAFFAKSQPDKLSLATLGFDDALLTLLQDHVKTERAMANEFVRFPSVDSLYARPSLTMH
jgi:hypothetical protein